METRREISAGGVVYRRRRGKVQGALAARRTRRGDPVWGVGGGVRVRKLVHFFLMRVTGGNVAEHDEEMEDVRWFPLADAAKAAGYKGGRPATQRGRAGA